MQIIHYLKCWQKDLGLLVNFGTPKVNIKRIVWHESSLMELTVCLTFLFPANTKSKQLAATIQGIC